MRTWLLNLCRRCPAPPPVPGIPHPVAVPVPAPEDAPEFSAEDRCALLAYLRSPAGASLLLTMRYQEEILKQQACDDTEKRVDHARGQAVGYRKAIATLIVLSAPQPSKEELAEKPAGGADDLRDQLSHT